MEIEELVQKLYSKTLNFVSLQSRTKKEVEDKIEAYLKKENLTSAEKDQIKNSIIDILLREKIVNDDLYAKNAALSFGGPSKNKSALQVKLFLKKKGLPENLISKVLAELGTEHELIAVERLAKKKIRLLREADPYKLKKRLITYLLSKGFSYEAVYSVVDSLCGVK